MTEGKVYKPLPESPVSFVIMMLAQSANPNVFQKMLAACSKNMKERLHPSIKNKLRKIASIRNEERFVELIFEIVDLIEKHSDKNNEKYKILKNFTGAFHSGEYAKCLEFYGKERNYTDDIIDTFEHVMESGLDTLAEVARSEIDDDADNFQINLIR